MSQESRLTIPTDHVQRSIDHAQFNQSLAVSAAAGFLNAMASEHHDTRAVDPGMSVNVHQPQDPQASNSGHENDPSVPQEHGAPSHVEPTPDAMKERSLRSS